MLKHMDAIASWHIAWLTEAFRVLRPGGVIKAFSGTRTFHRLASAMEETGFEDVRLEAYGYASGFPKSLDVSKAIDRAAGAKREVVGFRSSNLERPITDDWKLSAEPYFGAPIAFLEGKTMRIPITAPTTPEAALWAGWGTSLKPAWEPVLVSHKPVRCPDSLRGAP